MEKLLDFKQSTILEIPIINPATLAVEFSHQRNMYDSKNPENKDNYISVECPYLIQAAVSGSYEMLKLFYSKDNNINVVGHIGLSKKKKNSIISNVFGAACFYGNIEIAKKLIEDKLGKLF